MSVSVQEMCSRDVQVHAEEIFLCCRFKKAFFYLFFKVGRICVIANYKP